MELENDVENKMAFGGGWMELEEGVENNVDVWRGDELQANDVKRVTYHSTITWRGNNKQHKTTAKTKQNKKAAHVILSPYRLHLSMRSCAFRVTTSVQLGTLSRQQQHQNKCSKGNLPRPSHLTNKEV